MRRPSSSAGCMPPGARAPASSRPSCCGASVHPPGPGLRPPGTCPAGLMRLRCPRTSSATSSHPPTSRRPTITRCSICATSSGTWPRWLPAVASIPRCRWCCTTGGSGAGWRRTAPSYSASIAPRRSGCWRRYAPPSPTNRSRSTPAPPSPMCSAAWSGARRAASRSSTASGKARQGWSARPTPPVRG